MNEWVYVGIIVLGILTIQSKLVFTWGDFGMLTIITGVFLLALQEVKSNIIENERSVIK